MNVTWALLLAGLSVFLLLIAPALGLLLWSPERAKAVRRAEQHEDEIAIQVSYMQVRHPELVRCSRLDRHLSYLWIIAGLVGFTITVTFFRFPYESYGSLTVGTQPTMAISLATGSSMMAVGAFLGKRIGKFVIGRKVSNNMVSPILGDDLRAPYVLAIFGMMSAGMSMAFYGYTAVETVGTFRFLTSLGGISALSVGGACFTLIPVFFAHLRKYVNARDLLIEEAQGRLSREAQ